jgi:hypothetical protein
MITQEEKIKIYRLSELDWNYQEIAQAIFDSRNKFEFTRLVREIRMCLLEKFDESGEVESEGDMIDFEKGEKKRCRTEEKEWI